MTLREQIPVGLKVLVPGYRAGWRARTACFLAETAALAPRLRYGWDDRTPWIEIDTQTRFYGFETELENRELFAILRPNLPHALPLSHFRLVKDVLTRFLYPHMRPDLKPVGYLADAMFGFHGQHKDAIADLPDASERALLTEAFRPKNGEVFLDCGAFIGMGEVHLAQAISGGRYYAIEASHACHELLERNLQHNKIEGARAIHRAVWNEDTELHLEASYAQANSLVRAVHVGMRTETVRTISLDDAMTHFELDRLDMLSLTLNGAEVEAIRGGQTLLGRLRPRIRLAGWYERDGRKIWQITKDQLEALNYWVFVGPRGNVMALPRERT